MSEQIFKSILEGAPDAMVVINKRGEIIMINAQTERMFGYNKQELIGQLVEFLIPPEFYTLHKQHRDDYLKNPRTRPMGSGLEVCVSKKSNEQFSVEISLSPVDTDDGLLILAAIRDITERRKSEQLAREREAQLQASEQKLRAILEGAPDAMVIINHTGEIIMTNAQAEKMFGYRKEELSHKPIEALLPAALFVKHQQYCEAYINNPSVMPVGSVLELSASKKSDEQFPVEVSLSPVNTAEGLLILAAIRDISERKKTDEVQALFSSIIKFSDDAIMSKDITGTIKSWNHAAERLYGYKAEEVLGKSVTIIFPKNKLPEYYEIMSKVRRDEYVRHYETERVHKNGMTLQVSITISPLKDRNGNIVGASSIARDITEHKHIERMKSEFISVVSHELRTPLTSIHGSLVLLASGKLGALQPVVNEFLNIAKTNCERLIRLINDILDIEKIESDSMRFHYEIIDLDELLQHTVITNQVYADKYHVSLNLQSSPFKVTVRADRDRLLQVLTNLISNAIKFSPFNGSVMLMCSFVENQRVRVSIADRGEGIPEIFKDRIFHRFAQADSSSTRKHEGTGLGLSICKAIIERLGGTIGFNSNPGNGSIFYFELPLVDTAAKPIMDIVQCPDESKQDNKFSILHIEDDIDLARIISIGLEPECLITHTTNINMARKLLHKHYYHTVILDQVLADGNGLVLIPEIKSKNIPIVLLTAYEAPKIYVNDVNAILQKAHTSPEEILNVIHQISTLDNTVPHY